MTTDASNLLRKRGMLLHDESNSPNSPSQVIRYFFDGYDCAIIALVHPGKQ